MNNIDSVSIDCRLLNNESPYRAAVRGPALAANPQSALVSVIIPYFQSEDTLRLCLEALRKQTYAANRLQIIAVNNANQETEENLRLKRDYPDVIWLNESVPGSYAARAKGIQHAEGEIFAFTDSDCQPAPTWIESGVNSLREQKGGIIGGRINLIDASARALNSWEIFEATMFDMANQKRFVQQNGGAATANLVTLRTVFERVGTFDSSLRSSGDREWVQRATANGEKLSYSDTTLVWHPRRSTANALCSKIRRLKGGWIMLAKRRPSWAFRLWAITRFSYLDLACYKLLFLKHEGVTLFGRIKLAAAVFTIISTGTFETIRVLSGGEPHRGT